MAVDVTVVLELLERWGYVLVFAAGIGEAIPLVGLAIPGQAIILLAGALAATGHLSLWGIILAAIPAGILGDALGYYLGRYYGRALVERHGARLRITPAHLARSDALFRKYGPFALVLARFSFLTRGIGPLLAGLSKMRARVFWPINVLGALVWAVGYAMLGYAFGASFLLLERFIGQILAFTAIAVLAIYGAYRFFRKYADQFTRGDFYVALLAIASGTVFGVLADRVDKLGAANRLDARSADVIAFLEPGLPAFRVLDALGSYPFLGILAMGLLVWLAARRLVWEAVLVGLGTGGVMLLTETLRPIFARILPPENVVYEGFGTFPSAHAASVAVVSGTLVYLAHSHGRSRPWLTGGVVTGAVLLAAIVAPAKLAQGLENPSDVLAGLLLGLCWLNVSILVVEFAIKRNPPPARDG